MSPKETGAQERITIDKVLPQTWEEFGDSISKSLDDLQILTVLDLDTLENVDPNAKKILRLWQLFAELKFEGQGKAEGQSKVPKKRSEDYFRQLINSVYHPDIVLDASVGNEANPIQIIEDLRAILGSASDPIGLDTGIKKQLGSENKPYDRGSANRDLYPRLYNIRGLDPSEIVSGDYIQKGKYSTPQLAFIGELNNVAATLRENAEARFTNEENTPEFLDRVALLIAARIYLRFYAQYYNNHHTDSNTMDVIANNPEVKMV